MRFLGHIFYGIARLLWLFVASAIVGAVIGAIVGLFNGNFASSIGKGAVISLEISAVFFAWGVVTVIGKALRGDYRRADRQAFDAQVAYQQRMAHQQWLADKAAYDADYARRYAEWHATNRPVSDGYSDGL